MAPIILKSKVARFKSRTYPTSTSHTEFTASKKDRRAIKSSIFRSKIEKASAKSSNKRRRPSKKLVATLESLAAALPEIATSGPSPQSGLASWKSKPGARKKKERLEKEERLRFGKNMAAMTGMATTPGSQDGATSDNRWTALRQHIVSNIGLKGDSDVR